MTITLPATGQWTLTYSENGDGLGIQNANNSYIVRSSDWLSPTTTINVDTLLIKVEPATPYSDWDGRSFTLGKLI